MLYYQEGSLFCEGISCQSLIDRFSTPLYIYSQTAIEKAIQTYHSAFNQLPLTLFYAVKANSNLSLLRLMHRLGTGFDIVSEGELKRVLIAAGNAHKVLFSGVNKSDEALRLGVENDIFSFNIESLEEIDRLQKVAAALNKKARISFRVNPHVDAKTHPYIATGLKQSKFGIPYNEALMAYRYAATLPNLKIVGISSHIGSQLIDLSPLKEAAQLIFALVDHLVHLGIHLSHVDLGGGIGIRYQNERTPDYADYAASLVPFFIRNPSLSLLLEPGRSLIGNAGALLTRVQSLKEAEENRFIIVDAGMNDLIRPSLYGSYHHILPVKKKSDIEKKAADVVGPICESGDYLGKERSLAVQGGDALAIASTGAYAASMASNYNSRLKAAELLLHKREVYLIRKRETFTQLIENELPYLD